MASLSLFPQNIEIKKCEKLNCSDEKTNEITQVLCKDYVLYETINPEDTLNIINLFINEMATYVPINDSLHNLLVNDLLNEVRSSPSKYTIDDLGYITYRNEVRLLTSPSIYKVLNNHFNTNESFQIIQGLKKNSVLIDHYIMNIKTIFTLTDEDIERMPFIKTGWSRDLRYIAAYKVFKGI